MSNYNGYVNESTFTVDLYFSNGCDKNNNYHVNEMLKIQCFKDINSFKKYVLECLKKDITWNSITNAQNILNDCDWEDLFEKYSDTLILIGNSKDLLRRFKAEDNKIFIPKFQIDKDLYKECKATIETYGYKYIAGKNKRFEKKNANAINDLNNMINGVQVLTARKEFNYYPTPDNIVKLAQKLLEHDNTSTILEPSCGCGNLINGLETFTEAIEINSDCVNILKQKNIKIIHDDFETFNSNKKYKYIIMNPPFSKLRDVKHTLKAYDLLEKDGVLITICSSSVFTRSDRASKELQRIFESNGEFIQEFNNKEFKEAGTNINTTLLKIRKSDN